MGLVAVNGSCLATLPPVTIRPAGHRWPNADIRNLFAETLASLSARDDS